MFAKVNLDLHVLLQLLPDLIRNLVLLVKMPLTHSGSTITNGPQLVVQTVRVNTLKYFLINPTILHKYALNIE